MGGAKMYLKDWNGREIIGARSTGRVLVVADPMDNLISTGVSPWPPPEIVQKLYCSRQERAFDPDDLATITQLASATTATCSHSIAKMRLPGQSLEPLTIAVTNR
jgi:hypothetical protein